MTNTLVRALVVEAAIVGVLLTVVADQVAHTHVEKLGGVNVWGYRGPVLHQREDNEVRLVVVGGDRAFGWGVAASEALAPSVRQQVSLAIDVRGRPRRPVTSATLGAQGLPPVEYSPWIEHYGYLRPDIVCIVPDPVGHVLSGSSFTPDRRSRAFAAFGYSPILPLVLEEKGAVTHSSVRRILGASLALADEAFGRAIAGPGSRVAGGQAYLDALAAAVRSGLRAAADGVVVVVGPDGLEDAIDRDGVRAMIASTFGRDRVRVVDLGDDPQMTSDDLRLDGFSFSTAGHAAAAELVAPAALELIHAAEHASP
jgi:hypothetical protein